MSAAIFREFEVTYAEHERRSLTPRSPAAGTERSSRVESVDGERARENVTTATNGCPKGSVRKLRSLLIAYIKKKNLTSGVFF